MNEMDNKWIGKNTIRPDGADKVTGRAEYAADTIMPGMIWGKVLRSPHPHATIKSINLKNVYFFNIYQYNYKNEKSRPF